MRLAAELKSKAPTYGRWDGGGLGTVGHYLSAISQMAQATGDPALQKCGGEPFDAPVEVSGQTAQKKIPESHVPVFVGTATGALPRIVPVLGLPLTFQTRGLAQLHDVTLVPFYRLFFERYALYWNVLTPDAYAHRQAQTAQEQRDADALEARTIDRVLIQPRMSSIMAKLSPDHS